MEAISIKKTIYAWQWNGEEKDLPEGYHLCLPEVHYSAAHDLVYFTYADFLPRNWISAKPLTEKPEQSGLHGVIEVTTKDGGRYWRKVLPFSFWSVKSEASVTGDHKARFLNRDDDEERNAFLDYAYNEKWGETKDGSLALPPRLEYRVVDGKYGRGYRPYYLKPTDWLVKDGQEVKVMSDQQFREMCTE